MNPFFNFIKISELEFLLSQYESPSFIYSLEIISHYYNLLKNSLPANSKIFYAQKSNPHKSILKLLSSLGAGCDTASYGEMSAAIDCGFVSSKIMLTGPAKNYTELEFAVDNKISSVNIESIQELHLLEEICQSKNSLCDILLRINPQFEAGEKNKIIGGSGSSKFGIDIEQSEDFFTEYRKTKNLNLKGFHIFNSSQILDVNRIVQNTKNVIDTSLFLSEKYDIDIKVIDCGGGFGIPYSEDEKELDMKLLRNELDIIMKNYNNRLNSIALIFEPGRYLTGIAGIYAMKVLYTKKSRDKNILLTDGGINHLLRPALIGQEHKIINLTAKLEERKNEDFYMIAGPLCTSLDIMGQNQLLDESRQGDILLVTNAGAYGYTESMPYFLSHKPAKEIFI